MRLNNRSEALDTSEETVIKNVILQHTVDVEFTTVKDVAEATLFFNALKAQSPVTGAQSVIVAMQHTDRGKSKIAVSIEQVVAATDADRVI